MSSRVLREKAVTLRALLALRIFGHFKNCRISLRRTFSLPSHVSNSPTLSRPPSPWLAPSIPIKMCKLSNSWFRSLRSRQEDGWQNFRRTRRPSRKYKLCHLAACWNKHSDKAPDGFVMLVKDNASSAEFLPSILMHVPK